MKKKSFFLLILSTIFTLCCTAQQSQAAFSNSHQGRIGVKNAILAKVNGKTISVIDVMKKMDIAFHKNFPHLSDSEQAKYQFYLGSWKHVLNEIVDSQLILADAESKEIKIEDAEIRKEVDKKFGPNIMLTLDQIGITYDEAWEITKEEMLVQRMSWFRVNAKAFQSVTPQEIKKEYIRYLDETPPKKEWEYNTISIRSSSKEISENVAKNISAFIQKHSNITEIKKHIEKLENSHDDCSISISNTYKVKDIELSKNYKNVLQSLKKNTFSAPILQPTKNKNSFCYRLFHLKDCIEENPEAFEDLYVKLENRILQKSVEKESRKYLNKLRDFYCYDQQKIELKEGFTPFVLE